MVRAVMLLGGGKGLLWFSVKVLLAMSIVTFDYARTLGHLPVWAQNCPIHEC